MIVNFFRQLWNYIRWSFYFNTLPQKQLEVAVPVSETTYTTGFILDVIMASTSVQNYAQEANMSIKRGTVEVNLGILAKQLKAEKVKHGVWPESFFKEILSIARKNPSSLAGTYNRQPTAK
jgi:Ni,Fe-hydrogenase I cytochrome b subunit